MPPAAPIAFVYPGQGSQKPGMGKDLARLYPRAAAVFEEADATLGFALSRLCFEGPESELELTTNTQPALLAVSTAVGRLLEADGVVPALVLGHSLGEYSALVGARSLAFPDALRLVRCRGRYMQEGVPVGVGAMAALLGLPAESAERLCEETRLPGQVLSAANYNGPGQVVIAGHAESVARAVEAAPAAGARRAVRLPVSAPFHCALMQPAERLLAPDLERTPFQDLRVPLITNVDARAIRTGLEVRQALRRQVCAPVRWEESVRQIAGHGVEVVIEVGAGRVLSGLVRRIDPSLKVLNVEDGASFDLLRRKLEEAAA